MMEGALRFGCEYLKIKNVPKVKIYTFDNDLIRGSYCSELNGITINYLGGDKSDEMVQTLFHELVHCRQYELNHLRKIELENGVKYSWKKNGVKSKSFSMQNFKTYWILPHEQQARAISKNMFQVWNLVYEKWWRKHP